MELQKRDLRTIMQALKLQIETYQLLENRENIAAEQLAEVIMDRGYTESLLSAMEEYYNQLDRDIVARVNQPLRNSGVGSDKTWVAI
jgi:DNA-directed RNA polymerase specialized sigma54-like protein